VELLLGIVLASIFGIALYAFFFSGLTSAQTHQNQAIAQAEGRRAMDRLTRELRQAVSPDAGLTPPITTISPTQIVFHVDNDRTASTATPRPQRVRYRITGGQLIRESAAPIGTAPPYTYGAYVQPDVLVSNVQNGAVPLVTGFRPNGTALPASAAPPVTSEAAEVTIRLIVGYRTGSANSTLELTTDVAPRNPRTAR
jgi:Tfp pilus assembly protein PilW